MTTHCKSPNKQSEALNKVVDNVLNQILGQAATQIIYNYLENNHSIRKHEIAQKLDSFNHALEEYLGTGALVIERVILERLELCGPAKSRDVDFTERHRILKLA